MNRPQDYLNPANAFIQKDDLTTLEKDLDHPSPMKNAQRGYSADAPLSAV